ncbi:MAG TPA: hypothetical protein PKY30_07010, partial [Myxococcota bacterium]|nr:hypothetical protein [Myxococcota bacterium]
MSGPVQRSRSYLGLSFVVEHQPSSGQVHGTAILLLPPMGYEDTCAYRPLRVLADQLAQQGHLVQRLDWPGLGDSAGNAETPELIQQCITTVRQAAAALRARGLRRVAAVGVRAGALLALAAGGAAVGGLDEVVLWAMPPRGKAYMREESTFHRMAAAAFGAVPDTAPRLPEGSVEAGGFWYSPSTVAAMNKLDSVELAAQATFERVLLIERDGASPSAPLLAAFGQAGSPVQVQEGSGLRDLLENPYQAKMDPALAEGIVSWFKNAGPRLSVGPAGGSPELRMTGVTGALAGPGEVARVLERPWLQPGGAGELSGILCLPARPVQPGTPWTIFYNAGGIRRCGPNRLWTGAARALAARGRPSLRIDVRDVGDSDGTSVPHGDLEAMYAESSIDDATAAYDWVEAQSAAAIDVIGLCSGAFLGVQVAARRRVRR